MDPVKYIDAITQRYEGLGYKPYRWFVADSEPPWQPLEGPLDDIRLGMLTTSGIYGLGQVAFHFDEDISIRQIPMDIAEGDLRFSHSASVYLDDAKRDPNCVMPVGTLRRLAGEGLIGQLAAKYLSCMGAVYSARRVREELAPTVLETFKQQNVDAALLVPM
jgi:D-proline reductase (dithiol) PrdB